MAEYDIKYKTGDEIFVSGKIQKAEVINGKVYYKIAEAKELIPQDRAFPKKVQAKVNIVRGDFSELDDLENKINNLNEACEKARSIIADLAEKEISVSVKPEILQ